MKVIVTLIALTLSINAFANSIGGTSVLTWYTTTAPSSFEKKEANDVLQAADEYHANGTMSAKLGQQVSDLQEVLEVSTSEAVDLLSARANEILN